ncbi:hypothetical protein TNCV_1460261 [Trichonephila clavipes]|nr:hypothetical protein TNCV_1460261 [Trichonephila clavipes]
MIESDVAKNYKCWLGGLETVGSLVVRASDSRPEGLGSMPDATKYSFAYAVSLDKPGLSRLTDLVSLDKPGLSRLTDTAKESIRFRAEIVEVEIAGVAIYRPFGEFRRDNSYCHLYGAQGQRQAYF